MGIQDVLIFYSPIILTLLLQWLRFEHRITKVETKLDILIESKKGR
jgi:hypothetical protein